MYPIYQRENLELIKEKRDFNVRFVFYMEGCKHLLTLLAFTHSFELNFTRIVQKKKYQYGLLKNTVISLLFFTFHSTQHEKIIIIYQCKIE